jgi:hypothetical protein
MTYLGQQRNGIPNGFGTMTWKDGQIYNGKRRYENNIKYRYSGPRFLGSRLMGSFGCWDQIDPD